MTGNRNTDSRYYWFVFIHIYSLFTDKNTPDGSD